MIQKADEGNLEHAKDKRSKTNWSQEQTSLNSEVLYFICALIGSRAKCGPKKKIKDLYALCYTDMVEIASNNFSSLYTNSNFDMFTYTGPQFQEKVIIIDYLCSNYLFCSNYFIIIIF